MTCHRCQGFMVSDLVLDLAETQGMWIKIARCMNCGYVMDPVMERNRQQSISTRILAENAVLLPQSSPVPNRSSGDTNLL